jgi:hypothetical protein
MSWTDNLGKISKNVVDFTGIPGLMHDMSNVLSNDDPWYVDGINLVKNVAKVGTTPVRGAVKGLLAVGEKSYEIGGIARRQMEETLLDTPLMYNKFKNSGESFDAYRQRVAANKDQISLGQATLSILSPGKNAGERSGWFADVLDNNLKFLSAGFDLFDAEDRKAAFDDQFTGKFLSGTQDLVASTIIDPLTFTGFLGKGAVIASKGLMAENINGPLSRAVFSRFAMTHDKMDNILDRALKNEGQAAKDVEFLRATDAKGQREYWAKKKVTNPDALAYMFGKVNTREDVVALFRSLMNKEPKAMAEIAEKDSELAVMLDNTLDVSHPNRQMLDGKLDGDVLTSTDYNQSVGSIIEDLKKTDPAFLEKYNEVATGRPFTYGFEKGFLQESRFGAVNKATKATARTFGEAQSATFLKTSLHPLIKIGHFFSEELPSGVFNVNDANSYTEFSTFLRQVNDLTAGKFSNTSKGLADEYLGAITPGDRLDVIKRAERLAINDLFPNYDTETLDKIYRIYDARRASLIERHNNQGFLGYFDNGQFVNMTSPLLQRQGANTVVIMDIGRLAQGVKAHERVLPTLLQGLDVDNLAIRSAKTSAALDTINSIFKTSVLMRFGYTVRNLTEAQLSMMAKGIALPAMVAANGKAGVERFFNNRKVGFNRLVDQVNIMSGKADDFNVLQHEIGSANDMLRSVEMGRQQLAKAVSQRIGEIERDRFRLRLTGDTGPLTVEDELNTLKGVLAELESVTLYHGSTGPLALDKTRALATSGSPDIARRYTGTGTIHSVEQYIATPSGRPGKLGAKPELYPPGKLGSDDVVDQMPYSDFRKYIASWVSESSVDTDIIPRNANNFLRGELYAEGNLLTPAPIPEKYKEWVEGLNRTVQRSYISKNTTVYRVANGGEFRGKQPGDIVEFKGITSTSKEKNTESTRRYNIEIDLPAGHPGLDIEATYKRFNETMVRQSKRPPFGNYNIYKYGEPGVREAMFEQEVLLPAGTKFKVISNDDSQNIVLEAILPGTKTKAGERAATKRAANVQEAVFQLRSDMIDAVNAGQKVEIYSKGKWREVPAISYRDVSVAEDNGETFSIPWASEGMERAPFRVGAGKGKVESVRVYGKPIYLQQWSDIPLELRDAAFDGKKTNFKSWVKSKGWSNPNDPVFKYMRENGYGRAVVADDARAGGVSHIALPENINKDGRTNVIQRKITEAEVPAGALPEPGILQTPEERRAALKKLGKKARLRKEEYAVSPYYTEDSVHAMINNGVEDAAARLSQESAQAYAHLDDLFSRLNVTIDRAESTAIKQRIGYGTMSFDAGGHSYTLPKAFEEASWFLGRTSADQTWNSLVGTHEMAFTAGVGSRTVRTIDPSDPKYYEGWANILNLHFRDPETGVMDPVVRKILDGETDKQILAWFRKQEGALYAKEAYTLVGEGKGPTKIMGGELDEHLLGKLNETRTAVGAYIPDNETALMLSAAKADGKPLSGGDVQKFLTERFGKSPEKLQPLNGLLITSSKEYKDQERLIDGFQRRVMRFLGAMPEDIFARHPLTVAVYEKELRLNIAAMADAKGADRLTPDEINRAVRNSRERARQEVESTLFTIVRRTGASSSQTMKLLFPFYAAYENTLKRWGGMAMNNPAIVSTSARTIAQVVNGQMIVDRDGNEITDAKQLQGDSAANLVVRVPEAFIKALPGEWQKVVENSFKNISIPLRSLDVITQGNVGNPGFGPFATLPTYLIVKNKPELEDALKPFFPVGIPQSATDIFTPSVVRRLNTVYSKNEMYVRTYNQMLRYETYLYNQGKRTDAPLPDEIESKTNKFFFLRALVSISAPFAIAPEIDFYAQTFRQLQTKYADYVDPATGKRVYGMAEAEFLKQYPDFFEATVSLSKNVGGLEPSVQTVRNLRKHSNLMALAQGKGDPELIGFLADDGDDKYTFSQAAYQWQYNQGATPGAGSTYRQNRTSNELLREANVKRGWAEFQQIQQLIKAYQIQNGITSDNDPQMAAVKDAKTMWIRAKAKENLDWYSEYVSPDRAKYARRAEILDVALKDKKWMAQNGERTVVKGMALYLETRKVIAQLLEERDAAGGSRSLDAKSNADIADAFQLFRDNLIAGSPETEKFLNRYFSNDTVVV